MSHSKLTTEHGTSPTWNSRRKSSGPLEAFRDDHRRLALKLNLAIHRFFTYPPNFGERFPGFTRIRENLANSGLSLSSCGCFVSCHYCQREVEIKDLVAKLHRNPNIDELHQELSPGCPLFFEDQISDKCDNVPLEASNCVNYRFEACRLFSLLIINWRSPVSVYDLASAGFYFAGAEDNVRCAFCKLEVRGWEPNDTAQGEHQRWNPNCPFLNDQDVGNKPIGSELEDLSHDGVRGCKSNPFGGCTKIREYLDVLILMCPRNKISLEALAIFEIEDKKYPAYSRYMARLRTFEDWPKALAQKPSKLAKAGFFYTGKGDRVCCFHCGLGLKDWHYNDDPWKEHISWNPTCKFVLMAKGMPSVQNMLQQPLRDGIDVSPPVKKTLLCRSCKDKDANTVNLPCGHVENCVDCCKEYSACKICSLPILAYLKMYLN